MYFSEGLASCVIFLPNGEGEEEVVEYLLSKDTTLAYEKWTLLDDCVQHSENWIRHQVVSRPRPRDDYSDLDDDFIDSMLESRECLLVAFARASRFAPDFLAFFEGIDSDVRRILADALATERARRQTLESITLLQGNPANSNWQQDLKRLELRLVDLAKSRNRQLNALVEINAALAYTISQWFSGCVPIVEHEAQIRSHSLLGVGTAMQGLYALLNFITYHFKAADLPGKLTQFKVAQGFDILRDKTGAEYSPGDWAAHTIDEYTPGQPSVQKHLLTHFSARRGFRESQHCITAPLHSLASAFSEKWHLLTFTHEYLHAHVRELLAALYTDEHEADATSSSTNDAVFDQLRDLYEANGPTAHHDRATCLQLGIYHYCQIVTSSYKDSLSRVDTPFSGSRGVAMLSTPRMQFQKLYREINEIIVHVLDFQYFYRSEPHYIKSAWLAWSSIPSVIENLDEYVIRTLCAITGKGLHDRAARFNRSYTILTDTLTTLRAKSNETLLVLAADRLADKEYRTRMRIAFDLRVYLVDLVLYFFLSPDLNSRFLIDQRLSEDGSYEADFGDFFHGPDESVPFQDPIAFLSGCRNAVDSSEHRNAHRLTAWTFLALSAWRTDLEVKEYV